MDAAVNVANALRHGGQVHAATSYWELQSRLVAFSEGVPDSTCPWAANLPVGREFAQFSVRVLIVDRPVLILLVVLNFDQFVRIQRERRH